jgi:hypothetical protein
MAETHARITVVNNEAALKVCQFGDELLQVGRVMIVMMSLVSGANQCCLYM